jgi:drug/metabolite transporter (DMT)-like permease
LLFTFCAILCGPTIGVSLSLLATLYTNAGVAQTLMSLTPVLIIWPTWLIYRQKVTVLEVVGACVAVAGASLFFL